MTHEISPSRALCHKRLCPSLRRSVGLSTGPSRRSVTLVLKKRKTRIYDTAAVIVRVCVSAWQDCLGWVWVRLGIGVTGEAGGWVPLPTHPQIYWNPVSLVSFALK